MFETLTASARQVLRASQDAAVSLGHDFIGAEHLLLGLMATGGTAGEVLRRQGAQLEPMRAETARQLEISGVAAGSGKAARDALAAIGVDVAQIRRQAEATFGEGVFRFPRPGWSAAAKKALQRALAEAVDRGKQEIETEHLLLGVLGDEGGVVIRVLDRLGVDPGELRRAVADAAG